MSRRKAALSGQVSDADLRLLRIYRKVVECGGFSAAEVELNISRAAISMAMRLVLVRRRGAARAMPGQSCLPLCGFRMAGRTGAHACRCNGLQRQCGDQHPQNEFAHGIQHGEKV